MGGAGPWHAAVWYLAGTPCLAQAFADLGGFLLDFSAALDPVGADLDHHSLQHGPWGPRLQRELSYHLTALAARVSVLQTAGHASLQTSWE